MILQSRVSTDPQLKETDPAMRPTKTVWPLLHKPYPKSGLIKGVGRDHRAGRRLHRRGVRRAGLIDDGLFAAEKKRVSSRLKEIDERLRSKIEAYERDNPDLNHVWIQ